MAFDSNSPVQNYSKIIGAIFIFNLIVGTGCLAMPKSFHDSGYVLSSIILIFLAFMSFLPATLLIESMSILNALGKLEVSPHVSEVPLNNDESVEESTHDTETLLIQYEDSVIDEASSIFVIEKKYEMSDMVSKLCGRVLNIVFALNISIYLYGDLSVYSAAVAKSIRNVACTFQRNKTNFTTGLLLLPNDDPCWDGVNISRMNAYRLFIVVFGFVMLPLFYKRASIFQILTTITRWLAIGLMLIMAIIQIVKNKSDPSKSFTPTPFRPAGLMSFFGVCVYSFMCHHSLPRLITPIKRSEKNLLLHVMMPVYVTILILYLLLSNTGVWAFENLQDFYPLNFLPDTFSSSKANVVLLIVDYFLALFPVFTLSSNFPIIGCTLVSNLTSLCKLDCFSRIKPKFVYLIFVLMAMLPSLTLSILTDDLEFLVGFTGAFAGSGIQYVFPAILVYNARKKLLEERCIQSFNFLNSYHHSMSQSLDPQFDSASMVTKRIHDSPFRSKIWLILLIFWAVICIILIFVKKILDLSGVII